MSEYEPSEPAVPISDEARAAALARLVQGILAHETAYTAGQTPIPTGEFVQATLAANADQLPPDTVNALGLEAAQLHVTENRRQATDFDAAVAVMRRLNQAGENLAAIIAHLVRYQNLERSDGEPSLASAIEDLQRNVYDLLVQASERHREQSGAIFKREKATGTTLPRSYNVPTEYRTLRP